MEAFVHSDPRIEQWIDQITEKLFTVCLLTGTDSELEFQRGCEIVTKVTHLLQGISIFPSESLEDGLKQLLQQQLPDSRVINNFPTFQDTMNKMLHDGMKRAIDTPENTKDDPTEDASDNSIVHCDQHTVRSEDVLNDVLNVEDVNEPVIAAFASVDSTITNDISTVIDSSLVPLIPAKYYGIIRKTHVPEQADRLKHVLNTIFPNVSVAWNLKLMGQTFLAQVEDILICLHNPEQLCQVETLNKEGWKVYVCCADDLLFPRRLERGIRQTQRLGKLCKNA